MSGFIRIQCVVLDTADWHTQLSICTLRKNSLQLYRTSPFGPHTTHETAGYVVLWHNFNKMLPICKSVCPKMPVCFFFLSCSCRLAVAFSHLLCLPWWEGNLNLNSNGLTKTGIISIQKHLQIIKNYFYHHTSFSHSNVWLISETWTCNGYNNLHLGRREGLAATLISLESDVVCRQN
jgi:hypothetical protein